ncbi:MAG: hypothetical protein U1E65_34800 [Myxococcota bacterium]
MRWALLLLPSLLLACSGGDSTRDASLHPDAALADAGAQPDAGSDAGQAEADAGAMDAVVVDAGGEDAAAPDATAEDAGPSDAGDVAAALAAFCRPVADHLCAEAERCGCGTAIPAGMIDQAACAARWQTRCADSYAPFVAAGARIDPVRAAACAQRIEAESTPCGRLDGLVARALCEPFAIDPAALGGSCTSPYCADGAGFCQGGTCVTRTSSGGACGDEFSCQTGLACLGGHCTAPSPENAACGEETCAPPLHCVEGSCRPLGAANAPCTDASACAVGLECLDGHCAAHPSCTDGICGRDAQCGGARACHVRTGTASCDHDQDCAIGRYCEDTSHQCTLLPGQEESCARGTLCASGLACGLESGNCGPIPGLGQPCGLGELGPFVCAAGFGCLEGLCAALPGDGMACTTDNHCAPGFACDFTAAGSFCVAPKVEGGVCQADLVCADGFHCGREGTCTADLPAGSPCEVGNECAGICGRDASGGLSCQDRPAENGACLFDDDCPSGLVCTTTAPVCVPPICFDL